MQEASQPLEEVEVSSCFLLELYHSGYHSEGLLSTRQDAAASGLLGVEKSGSDEKHHRSDISEAGKVFCVHEGGADAMLCILAGLWRPERRRLREE